MVATNTLQTDPDIYIVYRRLLTLKRMLLRMGHTKVKILELFTYYRAQGHPALHPTFYQQQQYAPAHTDNVAALAKRSPLPLRQGPVYLLLDSLWRYGCNIADDFIILTPAGPPIHLLTAPHQQLRPRITHMVRYAQIQREAQRQPRMADLVDYDATLQAEIHRYSGVTEETEHIGLLKQVQLSIIWTTSKAAHAHKVATNDCEWCGQANGGTHHIFWACPGPSQVFTHLRAQLFELYEFDPAQLPTCLRLCGLPPAMAPYTIKLSGRTRDGAQEILHNRPFLADETTPLRIPHDIFCHHRHTTLLCNKWSRPINMIYPSNRTME